MTTFDDREQAFENKFVHDEELRFKATARCNRLLGAWAADKLGLSGEAASNYARDVVTASLDSRGDAALAKMTQDLAAKGISKADVADKAAELLQLAFRQIAAGE